MARATSPLVVASWPVIPKRPRPGEPAPNLVDLEGARRSFSWSDARALLAGLPGGGLNIAHEAVDRHAAGALAATEAIRWLGKAGARRSLSYRDLAIETSRFASALAGLGVAPGDRVFVLTGRIPELFVAVLGALKHRAIVCPLFSAFGPEPIRQRMAIGAPRVLVTTEKLYRRKVAPIRDALGVEHVILVGEGGHPTSLPGTLDWSRLVGGAGAAYAIGPTKPDTPALLHFTSGTTGAPKGALHVHEAVVMHHHTGRVALDLHPDDVFWCTADPGWVTGTSYGIIAPLTCGVTLVVDEADFDAERWYRILAEEKVTVWYTAPTAVRMLMRAGGELPKRYDLSRLRFLASVGEPLNPDAVVWSQEVFGRPLHDNWWQTETGGILVANLAALEVRPGSMGRPLPGIETAVVERTGDRVRVVSGADAQGELAIRPGWPSMFRAYWNDPDRYARCFADGWYLTGDLVRREADGTFWFVGRADDIIKSAGHLIGPFEVESALLEHPAVADAAVIGVPDPVAGELVKAFVLLRPGYEAGEALQRELLAF
ncbi:MAG TPA: acetate--CoA ligase, partial [Kofleriaceae bacterium]|nr:acetate--CoA ligase [Kofleriaceae bacterium]